MTTTTTIQAALDALNAMNQGWDLPEGAQKLLDKAIAALAAIPADQQSSAPEASEQDDFEELLGQYWNLAYREGKEGVSHGTEADKVLHKLRQAARQARPCVPEWLPIETSPKTGRTILLGYFNSLGNWRTMRGQYFTQERIEEEWEDPDCCEEGWYETSVEADDVPNCWRTNPTHWMPLPQPPSVGVQSNGEEG